MSVLLPMSAGAAGNEAAQAPSTPASISETPGSRSPAAQQRKADIEEMKVRRVLAADQSAYTAEDFTLLARLREAQALGAFSMLRSKLGTLRGFAAQARLSSGERDFWLTVEGYREFLLLKSQDARSYFETHGVEAKEVFRLRTAAGKDVFDARGLLTQEGDELYNRAHRNLPAAWRLLDGRLGGNVKPSAELAAAQAAPAARKNPAAAPVSSRRASAKGQDPEDAEAVKKKQFLLTTGYVEIEEDEERFLLKVTGLGESEIEKECSLQIIRGKSVIFYLLSPSDPLFAVVARYRSGDKNAASLQGSRTFH